MILGSKIFHEENELLSSIRSALNEKKLLEKSNKEEELSEDILSEPKRETNG